MQPSKNNTTYLDDGPKSRAGRLYSRGGGRSLAGEFLRQEPRGGDLQKHSEDKL